MSDYLTARRYYLAKRLEALAFDLPWEASMWAGQQLGQPGSALPDDFPFVATLRSAGYTTDADLNGADLAEIVRAGLNQRQAAAVLDEFQKLTS